jgi:2-phosphosulfolactate phosphatase
MAHVTACMLGPARYDTPMIIDVVRLPKDLWAEQVKDRAVVVFDVLRATTTIATALNAGAIEVRAFDSIASASLAANRPEAQGRLLCGEQKCVAPPGFDLGNSPREFVAGKVAGKTIYLSTTNGTRAIVAARGAARLFAAALVNANATAKALASIGRDVTLLCAGTNGVFAPEDEIGAGAVAQRLLERAQCNLAESTREAIRAFHDSEQNLPRVLRQTQGGKNIIAAGLEPDVDFAARIDQFDIAVEIGGDPPVAGRMIGP